MKLAIVVMTDGRDDYLARTAPSWALLDWPGPVEWWMHDDTGDDGYRAGLAERYPLFAQIGVGPRRGFGGAIRRAWSVLAEESDADWIFWVEDDFVPNGYVNLTGMAALMLDHPHLAQVALKRQPWGREPAGGFMADAPNWYSDHTDGPFRWVETTRNWTTNPSLFRRELCALGWPDGQHSEGHYGFALREQGLPWGVPGDQVRFGFWGSTTDEPAVHHIGDVRAGTGY